MGLPKALKIAFPDHQWESDRYETIKMTKKIKKIGEEVKEKE
jgi:hypothetical protein